MFPLGMVLLPGGVLPLQVFEPRYLALVNDLLSGERNPEFGQVLITHGAEAGGGDERAAAGTIAQVVQIQPAGANRYAMMAVGTRRIRIEQWLGDDPYPLAQVADWPDIDDWAEREQDGSPEEIVAQSEAHVRAVLDLAVRVDDISAGLADFRLTDETLAATYHLSAVAPIGPADRYRMLTAQGPAQRLGLLSEALDDVEAALRFRLS